MWGKLCSGRRYSGVLLEARSRCRALGLDVFMTRRSSPKGMAETPREWSRREWTVRDLSPEQPKTQLRILPRIPSVENWRREKEARGTRRIATYPGRLAARGVSTRADFPTYPPCGDLCTRCKSRTSRSCTALVPRSRPARAPPSPSRCRSIVTAARRREGTTSSRRERRPKSSGGTRASRGRRTRV